MKDFSVRRFVCNVICESLPDWAWRRLPINVKHFLLGGALFEKEQR